MRRWRLPRENAATHYAPKKNPKTRLPCRTMAALLKKLCAPDQRVLTPAWQEKPLAVMINRIL
jgi:hypothetical protein